MSRGTPIAEQRAIAQLKKGDIEGLETLVRKYQVQALRAAYMVTHDLPLAEEIVQESFLHVYKRIELFDHNRPFFPWFMRVVINSAITASKRRSKSISFSNLVGDRDVLAEDFLCSALPSPEEEVSARLLAERVGEALEKLTPRQRAVIVQRYYLEMNEKEMAEELKLPVGTIKWRLHAARQRLRILLSSK